MSKEILTVVEVVSNEKGVEKDVIFGAIEAALASAAAKKHDEDIDARVQIDRKTGEHETFRRWMVFEDESTELEFPDQELRMIDAVDIDENATPGEYVEVPIDSVEFGRISAEILPNSTESIGTSTYSPGVAFSSISTASIILSS